MSRHKPDWSELYPEILTLIADKLPTGYDVCNFQSVCKNWRCSITQIPNHLPFLSPQFPLKLSRSIWITDPEIVANSTFLVRLPKPWLITLEEPNAGNLVIRKPLKRDPIVTPENLGSLDWSKYSVREICRAYTLRGGHAPRHSSKVVLFCSPASDCNSVNDGHALMLSGRGTLKFLSLKNGYNYGYFKYSRISCFDDIVNYKGAIWAADRKGRAYFVAYDCDPKHLSLKLYANDSVAIGCGRDTRKWLVESSEGLYLIHRCDEHDLIKFRVYKLDEAARKWSEVRSLDGRILFVTPDCCFFGLVEDFPGWQGNCIVFRIGQFPSYWGSTPSGADNMLTICVFCMDDGESGLISPHRGCKLISNHLDFSEIFWPPPQWLFSHTCPSRFGRGDGEDNEEDTLEGHCTAENSSAINGRDQCDAVDVHWSDVPSKLLTEIAKHLKTPIDICRFRGVCKKWRASFLPPNSNLLSSLLPHKISTSVAMCLDTDKFPSQKDLCSLEKINKSFALVASTVYLVQPSTDLNDSSKSWLVTVEEVNPGKLFLRMPLRRSAIENLPDNFP